MSGRGIGDVLRLDFGSVATSPRERNGSRPRSCMSMVGAACALISFIILWMLRNPVHFCNISEDMVTRAGVDDGMLSLGGGGVSMEAVFAILRNRSRVV